VHFGLCTGLLQEEPERTDSDEIGVTILNRRRRLPRLLYSLLSGFIERVDTGMLDERLQDRGQAVGREVGRVALIVRNDRDAERTRRDRGGEVVRDHGSPPHSVNHPQTDTVPTDPEHTHRPSPGLRQDRIMNSQHRTLADGIV
jgi:hypothetical protein